MSSDRPHQCCVSARALWSFSPLAWRAVPLMEGSLARACCPTSMSVWQVCFFLYFSIILGLLATDIAVCYAPMLPHPFAAI